MGGISVCCGRLFMSCPSGDEEATRNLAPLLVPTSPVLAEKSPALTEEKFSPSSLSFAVRAVPAWDVNKGWILSQFTSLTNVGFHYCLGIKHFLKCKFLSCKESHLKKKGIFKKELSKSKTNWLPNYGFMQLPHHSLFCFFYQR